MGNCSPYSNTGISVGQNQYNRFSNTKCAHFCSHSVYWWDRPYNGPIWIRIEVSSQVVIISQLVISSWKYEHIPSIHTLYHW